MQAYPRTPADGGPAARCLALIVWGYPVLTHAPGFGSAVWLFVCQLVQGGRAYAPDPAPASRPSPWHGLGGAGAPDRGGAARTRAARAQASDSWMHCTHVDMADERSAPLDPQVYI